MSRWRNCGCAYCRTRGLMGPAILITVGVLFFIDQFGWRYGFDRTWPVIVIVFGVVKLLSDTASAQGHVDPASPWQAPPANQAPPPPQPPPPPTGR